jgi:hypothetical protein
MALERRAASLRQQKLHQQQQQKRAAEWALMKRKPVQHDRAIGASEDEEPTEKPSVMATPVAATVVATAVAPIGATVMATPVTLTARPHSQSQTLLSHHLSQEHLAAVASRGAEDALFSPLSSQTQSYSPTSMSSPAASRSCACSSPLRSVRPTVRQAYKPQRFDAMALTPPSPEQMMGMSLSQLGTRLK